MQKSNIVIFVDSNLGLESLARGNKTISINYRGEFHKSYINFGYDFLNKRGRFWTNYRGSNEIHKLLNYANKTSIKKWNKDNKIKIKASSKKPWGTLAIIGKKTAGSKIPP